METGRERERRQRETDGEKRDRQTRRGEERGSEGGQSRRRKRIRQSKEEIARQPGTVPPPYRTGIIESLC